MRIKLVILGLIAAMVAYGETFKLGDGITATVTPTHYKLVLSQKSRNGGTAQGSFSGPMKNGKRNGTWIANITFNNFIPDDSKSAKTGTITMVRNYRDGVLHGSYNYSQKLTFRNVVFTSSGWKYSAETTSDNISVKGAFDDGSLDGEWLCEGDGILLPSTTARYKRGVLEYDKVKDYGRVYETSYRDSIAIRVVTTYSNGIIEGWELSPDADLKSMRGVRTEGRSGLTKEDDNPLYGFQYEGSFSKYVVPERMAEWLLYMPTGSSDETAKYVYYNLHCEDEDLINYFGSEEYVKQKKEDIIKKKEKERRNSLEKIYYGYIKELETARDSIKSIFKITEEEVYWKNTDVNLNAPKIKEAWSGYLSMRKDIRDFIDAHKSDEDLNSKLENVIKGITAELDFNQYTYDVVNNILKSAEIEALKWGAKSKEQILKKALLCYPGSNAPSKDITYIITSDRRDGDGKGFWEIKSNTIENLKSSYTSHPIDIEKKIEWYSWLIDQYSYTPIWDISQVSEDDFFLWAIADNMKFDNKGNYEFINKKVKKPERVLQAVNAIRKKIPPFINLDNITVNRITEGGFGFSSRETVNAGKVYKKVKNSEQWLKLKESFAKAEEKASKKK
ncbi:MAG: hypothetical protein K2G77_04095 [Muribaculaceae bacterium]|nr:hypothetical protein [Muribaculaceae bacterium]